MLEQLDQKVFLFLNSINSPFFDTIMFAISGKIIWIPLYIAILWWMSRIYGRKFPIILIFIIIAAILADQVSVQVFKNTFQRLRPCHEPGIKDMVHLVNNKCGGLYGFVSSHASNSFNVAVLSLLLIRQRWFTIAILSWAAIIGYSRIYLGVHYPGDVICGALVGSFIGYSIVKLYQLTDKRVLSKREYFNPQQ